jgi:hypothetical protein
VDGRRGTPDGATALSAAEEPTRVARSSTPRPRRATEPPGPGRVGGDQPRPARPRVLLEPRGEDPVDEHAHAARVPLAGDLALSIEPERVALEDVLLAVGERQLARVVPPGRVRLPRPVVEPDVRQDPARLAEVGVAGPPVLSSATLPSPTARRRSPRPVPRPKPASPTCSPATPDRPSRLPRASRHSTARARLSAPSLRTSAHTLRSTRTPACRPAPAMTPDPHAPAAALCLSYGHRKPRTPRSGPSSPRRVTCSACRSPAVSSGRMSVR